MYICLDCGTVFDEPDNYVERHGLDSPPYEHWTGCPNCGGAFTEAIKCDNCGEWIKDGYIVIESPLALNICEECYTTYHITENI